MLSTKKWVSVKGYDGLYVICNDGRIKTLKRKRIDGRVFPEKILKPNVNSLGYHSVTLYGNGISWKIAVHRLVAWHFLSNPKQLPAVNHKDGNPGNNTFTNLEWCTYSENLKHSFDKLGRVIWNKGRKGLQKNHNTSGLLRKPWNKGIKTGLAPRSAFQKGNKPWNAKS